MANVVMIGMAHPQSLKPPQISVEVQEANFVWNFARPIRGRASFAGLFPRVATLWMIVVLGQCPPRYSEWRNFSVCATVGLVFARKNILIIIIN